MDFQGRQPAATRGTAGGRAGRRCAVGALAALATLAAGCTGGDDGLNVGSDRDDREPITRGNAVEVARLVVGRAMASLSLVDLVGQGLVEPVLDPNLANQFDDNVPRFDCDNRSDGTDSTNGTVAVTLNEQGVDDGLVSAQDTASLDFTNCRDLLLERALDGATPADAAVVAVVEGAGTSTVPLPPWRIAVDVEMTGLSFTDPDGDTSARLGGLLSTSQSADSTELLISREANTIRFTFDDGSVVDTLRNVRARFEENTGAGSFRVTMDGEVATSALDGSFTFETLTPLSGTLEAVPVSGVLRVEGDGGTSMLIRALQGGTSEAELLVDEDGDGAFDDLPTPIPVSWRTLDFF